MRSGATQLPEKFQRALALHQAGHLTQAQTIYEEILATQPEHADVLNLLGAIDIQIGNPHRAAELFGKAIDIDPANVVAYCNSALALTQLRKFEAALARYDRAISINTGLAEAHFKRGDVLCELGQFEAALASYRRAIDIEADYAEAYLKCGDVLGALKQWDAALANYDQAILIVPDYEQAYFNRGNVLAQLKRFEAARASYDQAIALKPDYAEAYSNRGNALSELAHFEAALDSYDRAIGLVPGYVEAHSNRGNALAKLERYDAALASYERAIALNPDYAEAYSNRGITLAHLKRFDAARASYERAIGLKPDYAEAYFNRGILLTELKQFTAALASYDQAIALKCDYAEAYFSRGNVLGELKQFEAAVASYDRAIALKIDYAESYSNRGVVLTYLQRLDAALASLDRAIALRSNYAEAHSHRGDTLSHLKRLDEALASYQRALELKPDFPWLYGNWLHAKMHVCDWTDLEAQIARLSAKIDLGEPQTQPFVVLALADSPALQRRAAEIWVQESCPASSALGPIGRRKRGDKIRIGYYSADYYGHATAYLAAQLFEKHDRERFYVVAFSFGPPVQDAMRKRLSAAFDEFVDVRAKSNSEIAQLSRELQIDIAVDLKGFTQDQRAEIFAHRAAPVQVSYLGYPGTMGAPYIDYIVADRIVIPEESRQYYTEKVVYVPNSYQPNDRNRPIADREYSREELGLPSTGFVFCCFNNIYKIKPDMFDCWMRILNQVEHSVLWLLKDDETAASNLRMWAQARGVNDVRLIFAPRTSLAEHLARQRIAGLFIDTLPCNAHTTASDALWAGLPVLTQAGQSFAARVAASLLNAVGLSELITTSAEQYESMAIALATDAHRLARIRAKLHRNRPSAPLFDSELSTRYLELAYLQIYERYQQGLAPECIDVK